MKSETVALTGKLDKLFADSRFESLKREQRTINSFDLNKIGEIEHSAILAWLLNPDEAHGFGDRFLRRLINESYLQATNNNLTGALQSFSDVGFSALQAISLGQALVETEALAETKISGESKKGRLDILVVDPVAEIVIAIENKYGSAQTDDQLVRYEKWVKSNFPEFNQFFIVLDAYESLSETCEDPWIGLTYEWIVDFINEVKDLPEIQERVRILLSDYVDYINEEEFDSWHHHDSDLIVELYSDHREVLEDKDIRAGIRNILNHDFDWLDFNKNWDEGHLAELCVIRRNGWLFSSLLKIGSLEPIAVELKKLNSSCDSDVHENFIAYITPHWLSLEDSEAEFWPIYISFYFKNGIGKLKLNLHFEENRGNPDALNYIEEVARKFNKRVNIKKAEIRLPFNVELVDSFSIAKAIFKTAEEIERMMK